MLVGLLAVLEVVSDPRAPAVRRSGAVLGLAIATTLAWPEFDRRLTLMPAVVVSWWLAIRTAMRLVREAWFPASRVATAIVLLLVPIIYAANVTAGVADMSDHLQPSAATIFGSLDQTRSPATLVTTAAMAPVITAWRASGRPGHPLEVIGTDSPSLSRAIGSRNVYTLLEQAPVLAATGFLVAGVGPTVEGESPTLWRVFDPKPCRPLTLAWQDVTDLAAAGQLSLRVEPSAIGRAAILYGAVDAGAARVGGHASPAGWPGGLGGFQLKEFDLGRAADRDALTTQARQDEIDPVLEFSGARRVFRLRLRHRSAYSGPLAVSFSDSAARLVAKIDPYARPRDVVELCRATWSHVVVGDPDAPDRVRFRMIASAWVGRGWHAPEQEGESIYRWTSEPRAEVRFFAVARIPLAIHLDLMPIDESANDQVVVSLNGMQGIRESGPAKVWRFRADALREGLNVLMIEAPVVPAPPGDTRRLGLKVRSIELRGR